MRNLILYIVIFLSTPSFVSANVATSELASVANCDFLIYETFGSACTGIGVYELFFILSDDFDAQTFDLYIDDVLLYEDQEHTPNEPWSEYTFAIENTDETESILKICADGDPECCVETQILFVPNCNCNVINEVVLQETICENNNTESYYVIDLDYIENGSEYFKLTLGHFYADPIQYQYRYDELPVTVGPVESHIHNNRVSISIQDEGGDCSNSLSVEYQPCEPTDECQILSINPWNVFCDGNTFAVNVAVSQLNEGNDEFAIYVNGEFFRDYFYNNTASYVGPLPADGVTDFEIEVRDNQFPECSATLYLPPVDCPVDNCYIYNLSAIPQECDGDTYMVEINFDIFNPTSNGFNVIMNDVDFGDFEYTDLPLMVGPLFGISQFTNTFTVTDLENENCTESIILSPVECESENCELPSLIVDIPLDPCNDDGTFNITVDFEQDNENPAGYDLYINDVFHSYYPQAPESPIFIQSAGLGNGEFIFVRLQYSDNPDCWISAAVQTDICSVDCNIVGVDLSNATCNGDNTFNVTVGVELDDVSDEPIEIFINEISYGTYTSSAFPVTIENAIRNENEYIEKVTASIVGIPDCSISTNLEFDGTISNLEMEYQGCNEDSTYNTTLNFFQIYNLNALTFDVFINNEFRGNHTLMDLPILFENITPLDDNKEFITICMDESSDCCFEFENTIPECEEPEACEITDLETIDIVCNSDGSYNMSIDFEYANEDNLFFDLYVNGSFMGFHLLNQLPLYIEDITPRPNSDYDIIQVNIKDNPDCAAVIEYEQPDCTLPCEITNLFAEVWDECNEDGTFNIDVEFDIINGNESGFDVFVNDVYQFYFPNYPDPFVTLESISALPDQELLITIQDNDNFNCAAEYTVIAPTCNDELVCEINFLEVTNQECNDDGTYDLTFNFESSNPPNTSFSLWVNNEFVESFPLNQLPITIPNVTPRENTEFDILMVCYDDEEIDWCCTVIEFSQPDCNNGSCSVSGFNSDFQDCNDDGTYNTLINFDAQNSNSTTFELYINNESTPTSYNLSDLPILLENITPRENSDDEHVLICLNDIPECCFEFEYADPNCDSAGDCEVTDLDILKIECKADGTYNTTINFEYENPNNEFFDLWVNNEFVGFYELEDLPIFVESITPRETSEFDIIEVCINDNADCCTVLEYEQPDCPTECTIENVTIETTPCGTDGLFFAVVNFEYGNTGGTFTLGGNGNFYGSFAYEELPLLLGPLEGDATTEFEFVIMDNEFDDCGAAVEYGIVDCISDCIGFEELTVGTSYNSSNTSIGDEIFSFNNAYFFFDEFTYFDGSSDAVTVDVLDVSTSPNFANHALSISNATVVIDFTNLTDQVFRVDIDFVDEAGEENLSVNGEPVIVVNEFFEAPADIAPGVVMSLTPFPGTMGGTLTFTGLIETIQIGGQEFYIDNICYETITLSNVWPGDANFDNISNHFDLLNIGLTYGIEGPGRKLSGDDWFATEGPDWAGFFEDGINYKHTDCNGDGVVNLLDIEVIEGNYGLTHGEYVEFNPVESNELDPVLYLDLPEANEIMEGATIQIPIILGSDDIPVEEIYGLAFTIEFQDGVFLNNSFEIEIIDSWLGDPSENLEYIVHNDSNESKLEMAITRTDHINTSGGGVIGFAIGIIDDLAGKTSVETSINGIKGIDYSERIIPLNGPVDSVSLITSTTPVELDQQLEVFPNPVNETLNVFTSGQYDVLSMKIYNVLGQQIKEINVSGQHEQINTSLIENGLYILQVEYEEGLVTRKFEVMH